MMMHEWEFIKEEQMDFTCTAMQSGWATKNKVSLWLILIAVK